MYVDMVTPVADGSACGCGMDVLVVPHRNHVWINFPSFGQGPCINQHLRPRRGEVAKV